MHQIFYFLLFLLAFNFFIFFISSQLHSTLGYSRKKNKQGGGGWGHTIYFENPLDFLGVSIYWKFHKIVLHPSETLGGLKPRALELPHDFSWSPWKFHLNIIWKKDFCHKFSFFKFLTDSLKPPIPASIMDEICEAW